MSKGPGHVQRTLTDIFNASPKARFTVSDLVARVYVGREPNRSQANAINRALRDLASRLGLQKCRVGAPGAPGWHHVWGFK